MEGAAGSCEKKDKFSHQPYWWNDEIVGLRKEHHKARRAFQRVRKSRTVSASDLEVLETRLKETRRKLSKKIKERKILCAAEMGIEYKASGKMVNKLKSECSACKWYPTFEKVAIESRILNIPEEVSKYLEHDAFVLPSEAVGKKTGNSEWADGSAVEDSAEDTGDQPSFPEFSKQIQEVIDQFGAVFVKSNWRTPSDATWVAATKTLKCTSLEDVYLLLKSSDRVSEDINAVRQQSSDSSELKACLILKRWRDINPSSEFRCFVVNRQLMGICQRDSSQFHPYIETDKYNIQGDIASLFNEKIKDKFKLDNYTFDVIRIKKDKVRIVDFGLLDESSTKGTLFTYADLHGSIQEPPEFRFIAEDMGIQPNTNSHFCVPQEINEFFRSGSDSMMDMIRREVETQRSE